MLEHLIRCPYCFKGEVYTEGSGNVAITVMCPKCTRCFRIRLDNFTAEVVIPRKRIGGQHNKLRPTDPSSRHLHYWLPPGPRATIKDGVMSGHRTTCVQHYSVLLLFFAPFSIDEPLFRYLSERRTAKKSSTPVLTRTKGVRVNL